MSKIIEALRSAVEHRGRISLDDIDCSNLLAEIDRLTACLKTANVQTEEYERKWYLAKDDLDALRDQEPVAYWDGCHSDPRLSLQFDAPGIGKKGIPLYAAPTPPSVPEPLVPDMKYGQQHHYAAGWNDAIDEMKPGEPT